MLRRLAPPAAFVLVAALVGAACGGSAASSGPTSGPSQATPEASVGGALAEALVAKLQADPFVTRFEQRSKITIPSLDDATIEATMALVISGTDLSADIGAKAAGQDVKSSLVAIGDKVYATGEDGSWKVVDRSAVQSNIDNMLRAVRIVDDPSILRHVGASSDLGRPLQKLVATQPIAYKPANGGQGQMTDLVFFAEEDGTPVAVRAGLDVTMPSGEPGAGTIEVDFIDWGKPVTIDPPV